MTMIHFHLFKLAYVWQLKHSRNGNPRWRFVAQSAKGVFLEFHTVADAGSTSSCKLHGVAQSTLIKVAYHETPSGKLMADSWRLASPEEIALWDSWTAGKKPSPASTITADSFEEWFEENVSDEDCQKFVDEGVDWDFFDAHGGTAPLYDRFEDELIDMALGGHHSFADVLDDTFLCSPDGLRFGIVLRAAELLAAERLSEFDTE